MHRCPRPPKYTYKRAALGVMKREGQVCHLHAIEMLRDFRVELEAMDGRTLDLGRMNKAAECVAIRGRLGLSQGQLGRYLGMSVGSIRSKEFGYTKPDKLLNILRELEERGTRVKDYC